MIDPMIIILISIAGIIVALISRDTKKDKIDNLKRTIDNLKKYASDNIIAETDNIQSCSSQLQEIYEKLLSASKEPENPLNDHNSKEYITMEKLIQQYKLNKAISNGKLNVLLYVKDQTLS